MRRLLARALGVAPGRLDLLAGQGDRNKLWQVDPAAGLSLAEAERRLGLRLGTVGDGGPAAGSD